MNKASKINLCYFLALLSFVIVRILNLLGIFRFVRGWWNEILLTLIIQVGCLIIIPYGLYKLLTKEKIKDSLKEYKYTKLTLKALLICFILGIIAYFMNMCVSSIFSLVLDSFNYAPRYQYSTDVITYSNWGYFFLGILLSCVFPAICEEFLHRGFLLNGLDSTQKFSRGLIYSSILFGLFHLNIYQTFYATFLGFFMGILVRISGSIYPAMIVHFMNNAINTYFTFAEETNKIGANLYKSISTFLKNNYVIGFLLLSILVCFIIGLLIYCVFALMNEQQFKKRNINLKTITLIEYFLLPNEIKSNNTNILLNTNTQIETNNNSLNTPQKTTENNLNSNTNLAQESLENKNLDKAFSDEDLKNYKLIKNTLSDIYQKKKYKYEYSSNIFLYASLFLGIVVTLFTFIWGVL